MLRVKKPNKKNGGKNGSYSRPNTPLYSQVNNSVVTTELFVDSGGN